jgi:hypothetical protein
MVHSTRDKKPVVMKYEGKLRLRHETEKAWLVGREYFARIELFDETGNSFQIEEQTKVMDMWLPKSQSTMVKIIPVTGRVDNICIQTSLWLYNKLPAYLKESFHEL